MCYIKHSIRNFAFTNGLHKFHHYIDNYRIRNILKVALKLIYSNWNISFYFLNYKPFEKKTP